VLLAGDPPVNLDVVHSLFQVVGGCVDGGVVAGSAHGDVGQLSSAAGSQDVPRCR
jgi:hypothetical protein